MAFLPSIKQVCPCFYDEISIKVNKTHMIVFIIMHYGYWFIKFLTEFIMSYATILVGACPGAGLRLRSMRA